MRTGALICAPDDEDDDCRGADEDDCRGAGCCAPTVPTTTMVALRTPTTFWNCMMRFCAAPSSASISHVNAQTPGGPCESTAKSRIGMLRLRRTPHARPSVSRSLVNTTVTARRLSLTVRPEPP